MSDLMFSSVFGTADSLVSSVSASSFLLCSVVSIVLGLVIAGVYMFRHRYSKNFVVTLALLPLIVQMVITLVNGNLGAGIAVMGVFNLVRFRSIPGSAKDIGSVFLAMAVGLATGMGFLGLAVLFTAIIAVVNVAYVLSPLGRPREAEKTLKIVVPEDLEFDGIFDDVLDRFAAEYELTEVATSNMGSLYTLEYTLRLREPGMEKRLIDEVRCLNGNLKVTLGKCELKPQGVLQIWRSARLRRRAARKGSSATPSRSDSPRFAAELALWAPPKSPVRSRPVPSPTPSRSNSPRCAAELASWAPPKGPGRVA